MSCFFAIFLLLLFVGAAMLSGSGAPKAAPVTALLGDIGAGKSGWNSHVVERLAQQQIWCPVISTTPIVLPRPYCLFMAQTPGDYLAAVFVLSQWVFSKEAWAIRRSVEQRRSLWGRRRPPEFSEEHIESIFKRMQAQYRALAPTMSSKWKDRTSINALIAAHNERVLNNRLDAPLGDIFSEAEVFRQRDFYSIADSVWGDFRFRYTAPAIRYALIIDEVGVAASADDNESLKHSAFYPFISQCRKLGATIWCSGHDPSRMQKQLRELVTRFCRVISLDLPFGWGRFYVVLGYPTPEKFEERRGIKSIQWGRVTYDQLSLYSSFWIVQNWSE